MSEGPPMTKARDVEEISLSLEEAVALMEDTLDARLDLHPMFVSLMRRLIADWRAKKDEIERLRSGIADASALLRQSPPNHKDEHQQDRQRSASGHAGDELSGP